MRLTGLPLILLAGALTIATVVATVRWWRRLPIRIAGLLVMEVLLVLEAGLIANRMARFYPSWQALGGTPEVAVVAATTAGRLDASIAAGEAIPWTPPGSGSWGLATTPLVVVPPDYLTCPDRRFPVVIVLTGVTPRPAEGVLSVVLAPTARTNAASLATVPAALSADFRVTDTYAVVAGPGPAQPGLHALRSFDEAVRELPPPLTAPHRLPS
ncbi:hypothetical protein Acy02nite_34980 [Actinoplanes cyaneus]|uniref:Uncharacterized protein n=1 Tax=Actinoplanes cyaneus TaxID=52696 RepID=A0A919M4H5_9ACTN|nr:hypothetical protein [Actinoplanes cyaneus]MCW2140299.1 hypothetical protein [Actinoplanes cyaneus]GID65617.1 hypothetical protein Acy02nite_34980 [Actinoplanes cyaneus]